MLRRLAKVNRYSTPILAVALLAPIAGCIWPGLARPTIDLRVTDVGPTGAPAQRFIVLQFWEEDGHEQIEPLSALVLTASQHRFVYPPRMYRVMWTPELGIAHVPPRPAVAVFAENRRPVLDWSNYERCSLEAPGLGPYLMDEEMSSREPVWDPDQRHEWYEWDVTPREVVAIAARVDRVERVFRSARGITPADRAMVYRQLAEEAAFWRDSGPKCMLVPRAQLAEAASTFERQAAKTENLGRISRPDAQTERTALLKSSGTRTGLADS